LSLPNALVSIWEVSSIGITIINIDLPGLAEKRQHKNSIGLVRAVFVARYQKESMEKMGMRKRK
jgi:hypothetical protein